MIDLIVMVVLTGLVLRGFYLDVIESTADREARIYERTAKDPNFGRHRHCD